jgi:hypothetical protein
MNKKEIEILSRIKIFGQNFAIWQFLWLFLSPNLDFFIPPKSPRFYIQVSISSKQNRKVFFIVSSFIFCL